MKKYFVLLFVVALWSCSSSDDDQPVVLPAQTFSNVSYGPDSQQVIDIHLPEGRIFGTTKTLVLVHGGAWYGGSKEDMAAAVALTRLQFPSYAIVNVGYRLATAESPAYPKQINDLEAVIEHLETHPYGLAKKYAFIGVSAGAHLSMLYAYHFDPEHHVKAVCSIVGPTDFTDPAYTGSELEQTLFPFLVGANPSPELVQEVSPALHIDAGDAPTIQFLGSEDPLVPASQGTRLKTQLDLAGITNAMHTYQAGHGNFSIPDSQEIYAKIGNFLNANF